MDKTTFFVKNKNVTIMVLKDLIIEILFLLAIILYLFKKKKYLLFIPFILCFIHIKISNETYYLKQFILQHFYL